MKVQSMREISDVWNTPPTKIAQTSILPTEAERWRALFSDPNPYSLTVDPLKYGPLTTAGFLAARNATAYYANSKWPQEPAAMASLLVAVGASEETAPDLLHAHRRSMDDRQWMPARSFETYLLMLERLSIQPTPDHALLLIKRFPWANGGGVFQTSHLVESLPGLKRFCSSVEDEEHLLRTWLPHLQVPGNNTGTTRLGPVLAAVFNTSATDDLVSWCKNHDDYQGLGYLVWQGRYPLHQWLLDVTQTPAQNRFERRERVQTLLTMLGGVAESEMDMDIVFSECKIFSDIYGHEVASLVNAMGDDLACAETMQWVGTLTALGALPTDHPACVKWLDEALDLLKLRCEALLSSKTDTRKVELNTEWYRNWAHLVAKSSPEWTNYLGKRMVLDVSLGISSREINACKPYPWLSGADVRAELMARTSEHMGNPADLYVTLVPHLSKEHIPMLGSQIVQWCMTGKLNARTVRTQWKQADPKRFGKPIPSEYSFSDASHVLYALTRKNPAQLLLTMKELGVQYRDPAYKTGVETWLTTALELEGNRARLPDIDLNTTVP